MSNKFFDADSFFTGHDRERVKVVVLYGKYGTH
jgi:hypothetical protein